MITIAITVAFLIISIPISIICYYHSCCDMKLSTVVLCVIGVVVFCGGIIGFFIEMGISQDYYRKPEHYIEQKVEAYNLIPYSNDTSDDSDNYYLCFSESVYMMQYIDKKEIAQSLNVSNHDVDISYDEDLKPTVVITTKIPKDNFWISSNFVGIQHKIINYSITIPNKESVYYGELKKQ